MPIEAFHRWKTHATYKLASLMFEYSDKPEVKQDLKALLEKIKVAKRRDMAGVIESIWEVYEKWGIQELRYVLPNEAQFHNMMSGPEKEEP